MPNEVNICSSEHAAVTKLYQHTYSRHSALTYIQPSLGRSTLEFHVFISNYSITIERTSITSKGVTVLLPLKVQGYNKCTKGTINVPRVQ